MLLSTVVQRRLGLKKAVRVEYPYVGSLFLLRCFQKPRYN